MIPVPIEVESLRNEDAPFATIWCSIRLNLTAARPMRRSLLPAVSASEGTLFVASGVLQFIGGYHTYA
jgi:hypothetical protein